MATHSSILAWEIPWTEGDWWATVHGVSKELDTTYQLNDNLLTYSFPSQEYSLSLASSLGFHNIAVKILARLHSHRGTQLWKNLLLR